MEARPFWQGLDREHPLLLNKGEYGFPGIDQADARALAKFNITTKYSLVAEFLKFHSGFPSSLQRCTNNFEYSLLSKLSGEHGTKEDRVHLAATSIARLITSHLPATTGAYTEFTGVESASAVGILADLYGITNTLQLAARYMRWFRVPSWWKCVWSPNVYNAMVTAADDAFKKDLSHKALVPYASALLMIAKTIVSKLEVVQTE